MLVAAHKPSTQMPFTCIMQSIPPPQTELKNNYVHKSQNAIIDFGKTKFDLALLSSMSCHSIAFECGSFFPSPDFILLNQGNSKLRFYMNQLVL